MKEIVNLKDVEICYWGKNGWFFNFIIEGEKYDSFVDAYIIDGKLGDFWVERNESSFSDKKLIDYMKKVDVSDYLEIARELITYYESLKDINRWSDLIVVNDEYVERIQVELPDSSKVFTITIDLREEEQKFFIYTYTTKYKNKLITDISLDNFLGNDLVESIYKIANSKAKKNRVKRITLGI